MPTIEYTTNSKGNPAFTIPSGKFTFAYDEDGNLVSIKKGNKNVTDDAENVFSIIINEYDIPVYIDEEEGAFMFNTMTFANRDGSIVNLIFNHNNQLITYIDTTSDITIRYLPRKNNARYNSMVINQLETVINNYSIGIISAVKIETEEKYTIEVMAGKVYSITPDDTE